jgi:hypothetical protein
MSNKLCHFKMHILINVVLMGIIVLLLLYDIYVIDTQI